MRFIFVVLAVGAVFLSRCNAVKSTTDAAKTKALRGNPGFQPTFIDEGAGPKTRDYTTHLNGVHNRGYGKDVKGSLSEDEDSLLAAENEERGLWKLSPAPDSPWVKLFYWMFPLVKRPQVSKGSHKFSLLPKVKDVGNGKVIAI